MLNTLVSHFQLASRSHNLPTIGLFAPSAGQHLRDEQRRRRSQFDRGTTLAEQEDYGHLEYHPLARAQRSCKCTDLVRKIEVSDYEVDH